MYHNIKKLIFLILILSLLFTFVSCFSLNNDKIRVYSADYPQITELKGIKLEDVNIDEIKKLKDEYRMYGFQVSLSYSDNIVLSNQVGEIERVYPGSCGYLVGFSYWEFMSGIYYYPYIGLNPSEPQMLSEDQCIAFLSYSDIKTGDDYCYVVTSWNSYGEPRPVCLYKIKFPHDVSDSVKIEKICDITEPKEQDAYPEWECALAATISSDGIIYVVTLDGLYEVTTSGDVKEIIVPELWSSLGIGSLVLKDNCLYMGAACGILKYDIANALYTWYQIPHEKVIDK